MQSLLQLLKRCQWFIANWSGISNDFAKLRENVQFQLDPLIEKAFCELNKLIKFYIYAKFFGFWKWTIDKNDAPTYLIGVILKQKHEYGFHPIVRLLQNLINMEQDYATLRKYLLAVVDTNCKWRPFCHEISKNEHYEQYPLK